MLDVAVAVAALSVDVDDAGVFFAQAEIDDTNHAANNARAMITSDFLNISFCLVSGKISEISLI
uniref:Uncharacterized protein n=1 Tax=mine drainage metagenome TaxID=410659 RepID=E6QA63_9ZZZZ